MLFIFLSLINCNLFLWPKPTSIRYGEEAMYLNHHFEFYTESNNYILEKAVKRYEKIIRNEKWDHIVPRNNTVYIYSTKVISKVMISIDNDLDYELNLNTDESYYLEITNNIILKSKNVFGALKGLETLSQLITYDSKTSKMKIENTPILIYDKPRYQHRGLLLDTSRNFYPLKSIKKVIKAMSYNKMNVFHWHLFDATSFPFKSELYPELWKKGAYSYEMTYSKQDIREIINYALERGVRVIPEIESPAHSYTVGKVYPELGVCLNDNKWDQTAAEPPSGQLDPTNPKSLKIVTDLIKELSEVFKDEYMHLSGDEVNFKCWETSEKIRNFIKYYNINLNDLLLNFATTMHKFASYYKKKIIVWQELLLNHNSPLPKDALVQVWMGAKDIKNVTQKGHNVIASSYEYWYLDCGHGGWIGNNIEGQSWCKYNSWQKLYSFNPVEGLTFEESLKVKGGEVTLWSEQADEVNVEQYLWPRAAAAAEVLWHGSEGLDGVEALNRLNNWRYRLVRRGVNAEPLQPLWCVKNPGKCNMS